MHQKYKGKWPFLDSRFCFGHNFLLESFFLIPFSLVICKFAALRNDTHIENIGDHIMAKATLAKMANFEKWPKLAILATTNMATIMVNMGGVSKCGQNADQQ